MDKNFAIPDHMQELAKASAKGLDALTYTLAELLNHPVLISSSAYKLISASSPVDFEQFQVELDSLRKDNEALFTCLLFADTFQSRAVGKAIAPMGRIIGYVFILIDKTVSDPATLRSLLDYTSSLCAILLQSRLELKQEQYKFQNAFIYDLLYGNLKRSEDIIATGEMWGWDFRRPHAVLLFLIPELEPLSSEWHLRDVLLRILEQAIFDKYFKNPAALVRQNEFAILVPMAAATPSDQKGELFSFTDNILTQLAKTELEGKVACGVGQIYAEPIDLFRSYQEAKVSLEMGRLLDIAVPFFGDLGLERILYKHDLQDLKEYYAHVLGALHKQDDQEGSLVTILESFADNQFDVNKTAQAIFLHRNTLRYRLNKIENILGKPLTDINTRLDIVAALKIKRLHKINQMLE